MKNKLSLILAPAIFCWCLFYLQACKEPAINDQLGGEGLDIARDTLVLKVSSEFEQPVLSNNVSVGVLGNIADPNFGKTYAGVYAQCRLTSNNISFGDNPVLDSAVLTLKYNGQYGKFNQPVTLSVFELTQDLRDSISYYTNSTFRVNGSPMGQLSSFTPNLTDSIYVYGQAFAPHLRVPLSRAFGEKILLADSATLVNNTAFLNEVKGFYITASSATDGNGMLYLDLRSAISKVTVYYHNATADSLFYNLPLTGVTVNHIDNIYTGTPVQTAVSAHQPAGDEKIYIQAGAGVNGKIQLTNLDSLPKNKAINKAELVLSVSVPDTLYPAPLLLDLFRIDDAGEGQRLEDEGLTAFGGTIQQETVNGVKVYRYRFDIKYYFQKLVKGIYRNNGLYVQSTFPNNSSERVVIDNSSTDKNYKVSLVVTYTKL